ncbi:hypothetical protein B0H14DRAFT_161010 [Mycena olivaceomarginata]|nr:hypothetical protein B0H14DRAFT_161010 [Mycena olivaceomarginata]
MYCVTAMLPHARDSAPDAVRRRHARHHAGAHAGPDKHRQWHGQRVTPALVVPYAAFGLSSVPSSRLDTRACCALRYHPQYVPCPQWGPQSFLTAGAAFISFSYATTIYCPRRTPLGASPPRHRRPQHLRQPLSTAHAAFVASLPILMILSAVPPPPLEPAPGTPRTRHAPPAEPAEPAAVVPVAHAIYVASPFAATVFSVAPTVPVLSSSASMPRTYAAHAAAVPHHPRRFRPVPARAHHLQRRAALTARLPCLQVPRYSPSTTYVRSVRRGYPPWPAPRPFHPCPPLDTRT